MATVMEDGSGGLMTGLTFHGGLVGIMAGNQQFTVKDLTFNNSQTAVQVSTPGRKLGVWGLGRPGREADHDVRRYGTGAFCGRELPVRRRPIEVECAGEKEMLRWCSPEREDRV